MSRATHSQLEKSLGSVDEPPKVFPLKRDASGQEMQRVFLSFSGTAIKGWLIIVGINGIVYSI